MHRIDAVVMDELSHSQYVVDIFGYCAQSAMNELGVGDLHKAEKFFGSEFTGFKKLQLARDVASGIADLQEIDNQKGPLIVHRDIDTANMLLTPDGRLKLNDFNSARLIFWDHVEDRLCGYRDKFLCGQDNRRADILSPEECLGEVLSEKVDTYAIGTILFYILTGERVNHCHEDDLKIALDNDLIREAIQYGRKPWLPSEIEESHDPAIAAIRMAMWQGLTHDWLSRPSARMIANNLNLVLSMWSHEKNS